MADTDTYTDIAQLTSVKQLSSRVTQMQQSRHAREQQWKMNLAWYKGRQYTYRSRFSNKLGELPVEDGDKPAYIVRLVANMILPNVQSLVSRMTKTKPQMSCVPGTADDQALKAAQMADSLLESIWRDQACDSKLQEALHWSTICSQGYWKFSWDKQAGKPMTFMINPHDQQPIVSESLKTLFTAQLQEQGIDPKDPRINKTIYMGDIKVEVMSPFDVFPDPSAKHFEDAKWVICKHAMDPAEIKARWGQTVKPDAISDNLDIGVGGGKNTLATVTPVTPNITNVYFLYVKPGPTSPKGRYCVWVDGEGDKPLEDGAWPQGYPTMLPIVKFPGLKVPGDIYDSSIVEHAIPLQKELNRTISQIIEYKNLTVRPQLLAPVGSLRSRLTNEPGRVNEYMPVAGFKPEPLDYGNLPAYIFSHLENIKARLDEVFFNNQITQGSVPPNVEAAQAIDLLQEMATDQLAPWILLMEKSIERAGQVILELAQSYYSEPRLLKIKGGNGGMQVKQFTQADINGNITVHVEESSALPRTKAGKQAMIMQLIQMQVIPPDKAYKFFELGDLDALGQQMAADEDQALREHDKIIQGGMVNQLAYQQAMQAVQQGGGMNPQTQQPFQGPQEIQDFLEQAAFGPTDFEDYSTHLETHGLFMKSPDFEALPPEIQRLFNTHFNATRSRLFSIPRLPATVKPPNINLQIKSTAGPSATAGILTAGGVTTVSPEMLTEPPLETWVSDDPEKDPGFAASNNPMSMENLQKAQEMEQAQQQHDQQMAQAEQQQETQLAQHGQKMTHADEAHQQKMRQATSGPTKR